MYHIKQGITKKEKKLIDRILSDVPDLFGDFYVMQDSIRVPLRDNREVFYRYVKNGDQVVYDDEGKGLALITGRADKTKRRYIKILTRDNHVVNKIMKIISWNIFQTDLYIQVKKNSKFMNTLQHNNFYLHKDIGNELILIRKGRPFVYQNMLDLKGELPEPIIKKPKKIKKHKEVTITL